MTQHTMVTLRLHRIGVILIVIGVVLFSILIFFGGYIAGRVQGKKIALKKPEVKLPALPVPANAAPAAATTSSTSAASGDGGATSNAETFTIRAGTYGTETDAKAVVARLSARKLDATLESRTTSEGTNFFVVFAGRFTDRAEADKVASTLAEEEHLDTTVVPIH
jgi:septal ring-binding cell division protein DamX